MPSYPAAPAPVLPRRGALRPLGLDAVTLTGGFWGRRQQVNGAATIQHLRDWTGRLGWVQAFSDASAAGTAAERRGREFTDSEVYKYAEASSWELARTGSSALADHLEQLATTVAGAQAPDGYLHTAFGRPGQPARYSDLAFGHELYCSGHLLHAAVAHARSGAGDSWLTPARRVADHICDRFGPGTDPAVCGHPGIETALVELYRTTGEARYLEQSAAFVTRRGQGTLPPHEFGAAYFLDDQLVRSAHVLRGHAVRALYLAAGAVDVAVETQDDELLAAVVGQWRTTLARRTYITGGMGSRHQDEAFSDDWVLPPDRAYAETCAGVAAAMLGWRLALATGDLAFSDTIERVLYNVVAVSPGDDGRSFTYANTLHQRTPTLAADPDEEALAFGGHGRMPWFEVSCCLPNVARLLASLAGYVATHDDRGIQLHQYAAGTVRAQVAGGTAALEVRTDYPADGAVEVRVTEAPPRAWTLTMRVPAWSRGRATVTVDGVTRPVTGAVAEVAGAHRAGSVIRLDLDVSPRWSWPDPRIDAVRGCVAVERGPEVLCLDVPTAEPGAVDLDEVAVLPGEPLSPRDEGADAWFAVRGAPPAEGSGGLPYRSSPDRGEDAVPQPVALVPYHRWGRRGPSTMRVWLPVSPITDPD